MLLVLPKEEEEGDACIANEVRKEEGRDEEVFFGPRTHRVFPYFFFGKEWKITMWKTRGWVSFFIFRYFPHSLFHIRQGKRQLFEVPSKESFVELKRVERGVGIYELWKSYHFFEANSICGSSFPLFAWQAKPGKWERKEGGKFSLKNCHPSSSSSFCGNSSYISFFPPCGFFRGVTTETIFTAWKYDPGQLRSSTAFKYISKPISHTHAEQFLWQKPFPPFFVSRFVGKLGSYVSH